MDGACRAIGSQAFYHILWDKIHNVCMYMCVCVVFVYVSRYACPYVDVCIQLSSETSVLWSPCSHLLRSLLI